MIIRQVSLYGVAEALNKASAFILLPFLTRVLNPQEIGMVFAFYAVMEILIFLCGVNVNSTLRPIYHKHDEGYFKHYITNGLLLVFLSSFTILAATFFLRKFVNINLSNNMLFFLILSPSMQSISLIYLSFLQTQGLAKKYMIAAAIYAAANIGFTLILLSYFFNGWEGRIIALTFANLILAIFGLREILRYIGGLKCPTLNVKTLTLIFKNGATVLPYSLSWWMKTGSDRLIIAALLSSSTVGFYATAWQLSSVIMVVCNIMNQALMPEMFKCLKLNDRASRARLKTLIIIFFSVAIITVVFLNIFLEFFFDGIVGSDFSAGKVYILPLSLIALINAFSLPFINILYYIENYKQLSLTASTISVFHVLAVYTLVPVYGVPSVLWVGGISAIALLFVTVYQTRHQFEFKKP